ncbi:citrate lyase subunit beta/citryl-CoA lyase [Kribbella sp. VKM Ac-2527]|uniref:Citrate lyase subunit beta/citryl-CoA lyase n=1 Tax=Kribbella caucasensis TaxID=2512215 RepID=A0A4V6PT48_9ACTN|nr:CoA ester lyase [Kribbella sp. VKM Ac-2527]TDO48716.1 citrate lyase subunit beta/citryl-CoA lyase [Kribbella sp. VKM Ac-2527]
MKPYRTVLFVPAHKTSWYDKAAESGADAVCFDLEDSVPEHLKASARKEVADGVAELARSHPSMGLFVRTNSLATRLTGLDLEATVVPGLTGIFAPKVDEATDVIRYDTLLDHFEARAEVTGLEYIIPVETIQGIQHCEEIAAASPRVGAMIGPTAEHADIAKAVGYEWSPEGLESLHHRTRILLATRAADRHPLTALWERIRDLDGLREFATQGRKMGFRGQVVLHPTHVPVVNEVYTPDRETIEFYHGLQATYSEAEARGDGAVMYGDIHVDKAHADKAAEWLARVDRLAELNGGI